MADEAHLAASSTLRHGPGLVVLAGPPGCGRSTLLQRLAATLGGPVHAGGGLAMLAGVPALALSRAVRARLPGDDVHLLAEAVRSRVRGGLLVLDDLHHCDPATIAALPHLARTCRVLVALRTPHRLPDEAHQRLRAAASAWIGVPPLTDDEALALARRTAARLDEGTLTAVAARAGGNPLAIIALARQAAAGRAPAGQDIDQIAYAIATALADLPRPARTALAALGLLGRPAPAGLLGPGAADLLAAGLVGTEPGGDLYPVSAYVAETAAGLLDTAARADMHQRLAQLTPPAEAARHLAAAGDTAGAYRHALTAADQVVGGQRAALLLFACRLDTPVDLRVRLAAADALLQAGQPGDAAGVLAAAGARASGAAAPLALEVAVLHGEALLQAGDPHAAAAAVTGVPDTAAAPVVAARDRVMLLSALATAPMSALDLAEKIAARHATAPPGVAAALAAVRAAHRVAGWDTDLAAAADPGGDPLISRWSAWLLVEHLAGDGRLQESAEVALRAAEVAGQQLAYTWQTRFLAAADWALALHGPADGVVKRATTLTDLAVPDDAQAYATAATALIEADTGLLAAARARLKTAPPHPAADWVAREAAWLDGQPERGAATGTGDGLLAGLHAITGRWAAHDLGLPAAAPIPTGLPGPARRTLTAWAVGTGFPAAADSWQPVALREQIRCLLAAGLTDPDRDRAVTALLRAEELADAAGLTVLAGRARRGLRQHGIHRDTRSRRSEGGLTQREQDVLRLVAAGEPTRRIAGQLGISTETVDTHIRASMRKLGARTRTEAAALAFAAAGPRADTSDNSEDGR
ncbi:LuxR family transcriptional regulator [Actinoplanes sp. SE50]|uniref:LuxR C-terminal-related transcriptional regulator n=1 Tax=unclassified Actinoplanes TaxID=2626549 RepID=UPI00023EC2CE|nr:MULTISPECIES: LuxR C-terminal-related transcriptional regulator [unclassified Actinoplanes]AEV85226.1 Transcriptional regulatory protein degU [Actinoplanes sp. SE50/110]ATO83621.1 LuxR family transcriptional regulator [Actinoplanes sp. SE50]SLM01029.1 LuxR-family transcriptional regulator [Actinoplanes sp. SE50/110]